MELEFDNVKYIGENTNSGLTKGNFYDIIVKKPKKSYTYQIFTYINEEKQIMEVYASKNSIQKNWKIDLTNEF